MIGLVELYWSEIMLLDLKKVFLQEGEKLDLYYEMDMSNVNLNGAKPFEDAVKVNVNIINQSGLILFKAGVFLNFTFPCDRCCKPVKHEYQYSFQHDLVMNSEDADAIEIIDYKLDLDALVISDILLSLPSKFLCNENCKGLCMYCGKDFNRESCDCARGQIDPRLESLKSLLIN